MKDLVRIKGNVAKMAEQNAPEEDIDGYIASEGVTLDDVRNFSMPAAELQQPVQQQAQQVPEISKLESLARGGVQGGTLGFGDEIRGGISSVAGGIDRLLGNDDGFGRTYEQSRDINRAANARASAANPATYLAGEIGSSLAIPVGGAASRAVSLGQKIKAGAKIGAGVGAVGGAGYSDDPTYTGQATDAAIGAGLGAGLGGAIPAAIGGVKSLYKGGKEVSKVMSSAIRGRTPEEIIAARLEGENINKIGRRLAEGNPDTILADVVSGNEMTGLTRLVGSVPQGAKGIISNKLENRAANAGYNVSKELDNAITKSNGVITDFDAMMARRKELSSPLYKGVQEQMGFKPLEISDKLRIVLNDNRMQNLIEDAKLRYGVPLEAPKNSYPSLDGAKKVLDDKIQVAKRAGEKHLSESFRELKTKLTDAVDEQIPLYKEARGVFSSQSDLIDAHQLGLDFTKGTPEDVRKLLKGMSAGEREAYKVGVRNRLQEVINNVKDGSNPAAALFNNQTKRLRLKEIFQNEPEYYELARKLKNIDAQFKTRNKVLGGSGTDINTAEREAAGSLGLVKSAAGGKTALINNLVSKGFDTLRARYAGLNKENAQQLAKILTNKEESLKVLESIKASKDAADRKQKNLAIKAITDFYPEFTKGSLLGAIK